MRSPALPPLIVIDPEFCVVSRRNDSLGTRGRNTVFTALCFTSLTLALAFAAAGAWVVLPYSVLELLLVAIAFRHVERHAGQWERLTVAGDRLLVEQGRGGAVRRCEFDRWRTRVEVVERPRQPPRLVLRSAGEGLEFGAELPRSERVAVARDLRRLTRLA
jgi:uncharacterized membrane protein